MTDYSCQRILQTFSNQYAVLCIERARNAWHKITDEQPLNLSTLGRGRSIDLSIKTILSV